MGYRTLPDFGNIMVTSDFKNIRTRKNIDGGNP